MTENQRRKFLKLVGASLAGAAGVSILGCKPENTQSVADVPVPDAVDDAAPPLPKYDRSPITDIRRKALAERLRQLDESEPPEHLACAMCYDMAGPLNIKEPCPECGEIMLVGEMDEILRDYNYPFKRIRDLGLDATLIIPEHCPGCGLGLKEKKFLLEIKYLDDPDFVRVELDEAYDLQLMALFLQGEDRYTEGQCDVPLKNKVDRLRKLFGVKEP